MSAKPATAAVYPIHHPRALWPAFGILPEEVWGPPGVDTGPGDAHLQAYTCDIIRNGLSFLLSGGLDETDLVVVPHGCDSLQGLGSVLLDFVRSHKPAADARRRWGMSRGVTESVVEDAALAWLRRPPRFRHRTSRGMRPLVFAQRLE